MNKRQLTISTSVLCIALAFSSNAVFGAEKVITRDRVKHGMTAQDGTQEVIGVYPVSPFLASYDKKSKVNQMQTSTRSIYSILPGGALGDLFPKSEEENSLSGESLRSGAYSKIPIESMEAMKRSLVRGETTNTTEQAASEALDEVGLCSGPRITRSEADEKLPTEYIDIRLKDCANFYPAEYTVAVNFFQTYMTWRTKETENLLDIYAAKMKSPRFIDRIHGRLMIDCIANIVGSGTKIGYGSVFQEVSHVDKPGKRMTLVVDGGTIEGSEETPTTEDKTFHDEGIKKTFSDGETSIERRVYEIRRRPVEVKYTEFAAALARCTIPYYWNLGSLFGMVDLDSCDLSEEAVKDSVDKITDQKNYAEYDIENTNKIPEDVKRTERTANNKNAVEAIEKVNLVFAEIANNATINYAFDFPTYLRRCVMTKKRALMNLDGKKLTAGSDLAIRAIPYIRLELYKPEVGWYNPEVSGTDTHGNPIEGSVASRYAETVDEKSVILRIQTYPMSISSEEIFQALRERILKLITSEEFIKGSTGGWIPSPFAPDDLKIDVNDINSENNQWLKYCSIQLPLRTLQRATSAASNAAQTSSSTNENLLNERITFAWKILADRIALLQTLEVLHGSIEIAQEGIRLLGMLDDDLRKLLVPSYEVLLTAVQSYEESIKRTDNRTITDIINMIDKFVDDQERIQKEASQMIDAAKEADAYINKK